MEPHGGEDQVLLFPPHGSGPDKASASSQATLRLSLESGSSTGVELQSLGTPSAERALIPQAEATSTTPSTRTGRSSNPSCPASPNQDAPPTPLPTRSLLRWWYLEVVSLLIATACLAAIVAVLSIYDGKPQASWSNSTLTLNGLVAQLSTLFRACVMFSVSAALAQGKWIQHSYTQHDPYPSLSDWALFEQASKGPLGSTQLLWRFKGGNLACIGAALSIVSLTFGLFSQLLIGFRTELAEAPSYAFPRATYLPDVTEAPIDASTRVAIYEGFNKFNVDEIHPYCKTGTCTWPKIPTLAVCGEYVDMTDTINIDRYDDDSDFRGMCNVTAKGGISSTHYCDSGPIVVGGISTIFTMGEASGEVFASARIPGLHRRSPNIIAEFAALGIPKTTYPQPFIAAEFAFWYCVQVLDVSFRDGNWTSSTLETWNEAEFQERGHDISFVNAPPQFNLDPLEEYEISQEKVAWLGSFFDEHVSGDVTTRRQQSEAKLRIFPDTDYAYGLFANLDSLSNWTANVAQSMSNQVRAEGWRKENGTISDQANPRTYIGRSIEAQVLITVRWGWIAYPAVVVFTAVIYLGIEAVRTARKRDIRPWKDDPLVTLYMQLEERLEEKIRLGLEHPDGVRKIASKQRMRFITSADTGLPTGFESKEN